MLLFFCFFFFRIRDKETYNFDPALEPPLPLRSDDEWLQMAPCQPPQHCLYNYGKEILSCEAWQKHQGHCHSQICTSRRQFLFTLVLQAMRCAGLIHAGSLSSRVISLPPASTWDPVPTQTLCKNWLTLKKISSRCSFSLLCMLHRKTSVQ